jgi:uncharacterized protein involved in exopolysaccharide biosynthesis
MKMSDIHTQQSGREKTQPASDGGLDVLDVLIHLRRRLRFVFLASVLAGVIALLLSFLVKPVFTARTSFLPPQQQQSAASVALGQLGALAGLAGGTGALKNPADQYVAMMQSETVADRIIEQFNLLAEYDVRFRFEARKRLLQNVAITVGRKDGLINVEVDDTDPARAAAIANQFVVELRRITKDIALTEAQQRRMFFMEKLESTRNALTTSQLALQSSGINPGAYKTEPKAAADAYGRISAQVAAAEVRLQTLRESLSDNASEVRAQLSQLEALRASLAKLEVTTGGAPGSADYVTKYREFKYQEVLFDLFSRQYELARLDESRDGTAIQVVDPARVPEHKSRPKRAIIALATTIFAFIALTLGVIVRFGLKRLKEDPATAAKLRQLWRVGEPAPSGHST